MSVASKTGILASLGVMWAGAAMAHALPVRTDPPRDGQVAATMGGVEIDFTEPVEGRFSKITVEDAQGKQVDDSAQSFAGNDARRLRVSLPSLSPGTYTVHWRAVARDTHRTEGSYQFTVLP